MKLVYLFFLFVSFVWRSCCGAAVRCHEISMTHAIFVCVCVCVWNWTTWNDLKWNYIICVKIEKRTHWFSIIPCTNRYFMVFWFVDGNGDAVVDQNEINEKEIDSINESIQTVFKNWMAHMHMEIGFGKWNMMAGAHNRAYFYWLIVSNDINSIKTSVSLPLFLALDRIQRKQAKCML